MKVCGVVDRISEEIVQIATRQGRCFVNNAQQKPSSPEAGKLTVCGKGFM
jgi:hypothetical protein